MMPLNVRVFMSYEVFEKGFLAGGGEPLSRRQNIGAALYDM